MNVRAIAAVSGTVLALSMGSALAWDEHDTLAPTASATRSVQSVSVGSDLQIPGSGSVTSRGAAYDFQCSEALSHYGENSVQAATFCR